jgi:hypothetical protein
MASAERMMAMETKRVMEMVTKRGIACKGNGDDEEVSNGERRR